MKIICGIFKNFIKIGLIISIIFLINSFLIYSNAIREISLKEKISEIKSKDSYVEVNNISDHMKKYIVNVEDKRFYSHNGIDVMSIIASMISNINVGYYKYGGSTITQQLAKNMYFSSDKKLTRKIAEMFLSFKLEREYSKDDILELYLNIIYFGNGYYGISKASQGYFGVSPNDLTEYQSSLLAGIPQAPSLYNLNDKNNEFMKQRYKDVLRILLRNDVITQIQVDEFNKMYLAP